ncbi:hypothetical protein LLEC1_03503 [Akanthomyces lecanii]|uniref:Uncharacterized protein n=1 Tax=Cordyceps confragosa TaxID=2714763 RepID=A0A179HZU5_CORDF|nr:hypothetical protein LLEC1_03503 [Akanthomyces lecanii]
MTTCGIHYRLRFLQKSHLAVKRRDDRLYACMFCVKTGYTLEQNDATVFFSAVDLITHISRHDRPLPVIAGITVLYGADMPSRLAHNYDVYFREPAPSDSGSSPATASRAERKPSTADSAGLVDAETISNQPTGVVVKEVRPDETPRGAGSDMIVGRRRTEELRVAAGAKLTGIKWPPQYNGRKVFAWHNGNFASVPSELVQLTVPPAGRSLVRSVSKTAVRATAKWKFSPQHDKKTWLKFNKGDAIRNITCESDREQLLTLLARIVSWSLFLSSIYDNEISKANFYCRGSSGSLVLVR